MTTRYTRWFQITTAGAFFGTMLQFPGADCSGKIIRNVNPCGTILNCDPLEYDLAFHQDEYPNWNIDPTCTIPGLCDTQGVPFPVSPGPTIGTLTPYPYTDGTVTTTGNTTTTGQ